MTAIGNLSDDAVLAHAQLSREQRRDASRFVLRHARDREDLHELLDALGLNQPQKGDQ